MSGVGIVGECIGKKQLILSVNKFEYNGAINFCNRFEKGEMVSFASAAEFDQLRNFLVEEARTSSAWTGLFDDGNNGNGITSRYKFSDGASTYFVNTGEKGRFPWRNGHPSGGGCVNLYNGKLRTSSCEAAMPVVCSVLCFPTTSSCFQDESEYIVVKTTSPTNSFNFVEAMSACDLASPGMELASITNSESMRFVSEFLAINDLSNEEIYFGLVGPSYAGVIGVDILAQTSFQFIDGSKYDDISSGFGQVFGYSPWAPNEPNISDTNDMPCVVIVNGEWKVKAQEDIIKLALCKRPCNEKLGLTYIAASLQVVTLLALIAAIVLHSRKMKEYYSESDYEAALKEMNDLHITKEEKEEEEEINEEEINEEGKIEEPMIEEREQKREEARMVEEDIMLQQSL